MVSQIRIRNTLIPPGNIPYKYTVTILLMSEMPLMLLSVGPMGKLMHH